MHYKIGKIGKNFFLKLLQTKSGMVINAFQTWKALPDKHLSANKIKLLKFLRGLENFSERPVRLTV